MTNNIDNIISRYSIELHPDGEHIMVKAPKGAKAQVDADIIPNKEQIVARLRERKAEKESADARVAAIEGLAEWKAYYRAMEERQQRINQIMDSGNGEPWPSEPVKPAEAPEAVAYIALETMSYAAHDVKATAGRNGIKRVRSGEQTPTEALAKAESEWREYVASI